MEYVFCDTQKELPETYEYLDRLQAFLGKPIKRLNATRGFDHWLEVYGGYLPSSRMRWCTRMLKIKPFEDYVGDDEVLSYIGIRGDEDRSGYISTKPNIKPVYPFKEDRIVEADVFRILEESGLGLPKYYEWRTRSGCYFCFFQRKKEWAGLNTWNQSESLEELAQPERLDEIRRKHEEALRHARPQPGQRLYQIFGATLDDEDDTEPCLICNL
jgi:3'-phosphoadenosine 5'-phosphosulfate sulfotransferase (PAPS reductase)/FAD synthetase